MRTSISNDYTVKKPITWMQQNYIKICKNSKTAI